MSDIAKSTFHEDRRLGIGSSDAAAVAGLSPYKTAYDVYLEKIGEAAPFADNEAIEWGNRLEAVVAEKYAEAHQEYDVNPSAQIVHPDNDWLRAHPDRVILRHSDTGTGIGILEVKTVGEYAYRNWNDALPPHYYIQGQHLLMVSGLKWGVFAILIGGQRYIELPFEADDATQTSLFEIERDFWINHVQKRIPPAIESPVAYNDMLRRLYPQSESKEVALSPPMLWHCKRLDRIGKARKFLDQIETGHKNAIMEEMGDADTGMIDGYKVKWTTGKARETVDAKLLKKLHPRVYKKVMKVGEPTRTFRLYTSKEES